MAKDQVNKQTKTKLINSFLQRGAYRIKKKEGKITAMEFFKQWDD